MKRTIIILSLMLVLSISLIISQTGCSNLSLDEKKSRVAGQIEVTEDYGDISYQIGTNEEGLLIIQGTPGDFLDFENWEDISSVSVGDINAGAIKRDGTVIATGYSEFGATDVESWSDVVMLEFTAFSAYGLKKDGTIVTTGEKNPDKIAIFEQESMKRIKSWRNIVYIDASTYTVAAVKRNGGIEIISANEDFLNLDIIVKNIKAVSLSNHSLAVLTRNGEVFVYYDGFSDQIHSNQPEAIEYLYGAKKICVGDTFVAGLMHDGTIRTYDIESFLKIDDSILLLDGEKDVIDINSHADTLVIMKGDGTIAVAGRDD